MIEIGEYATVREIAKAEGVNASYVSRVLRLTLLAPEVVARLVEGQDTDGNLTIEVPAGAVSCQLATAVGDLLKPRGWNVRLAPEADMPELVHY